MEKVFYFLYSRTIKSLCKGNSLSFIQGSFFFWGLLFLFSGLEGFCAEPGETAVTAPQAEERPAGIFFMSEGMARNVTFERWESETDRLFFQKKGNSFSFEPSSFLCWGSLVDSSTMDFTFVLPNGSSWVGVPQNLTEEQYSENLNLETSFCGSLTFSVNELAGILFTGLPTPLRERLLTEACESKFDEDVLIFRTGERISGEFLALNETSVSFGTRELSPKNPEKLLREIQVIHPAQNQIAALFFSDSFRIKPTQNSKQKFFWLGLNDGSLIRFEPGKNLFDFQKIPPEAVVYLESPQTSQHFFNESITSATQKITELRWLDELKPTEVSSKNQSISPFPLNWKLKMEPNGELLRSRGMIFRHGISVIAGTALTWTLDGTFHKFEVLPLFADFSTENETTTMTKVQCRILVNGKVAAEQILEKNSEANLMLVPLEKAESITLETMVISSEGNPMPGVPVVNWLNGFLAP